AKDSQKMLNKFSSEVVRKIAASNRTPWIYAHESVDGAEKKKWETSNIENWASLAYKAYDGQGRALPAPTRGDGQEPAIAQLMAGSEMCNNNIKRTVGIFDAGIGEAAGERQSGKAIMTLAQKGENNNFHFGDNLVMSMKRLGCLIIRLIPKLYDTARAIRTINPDSTAEMVLINQMFSKNGEQKQYDLTTDEEYDVV